MTSRTPRDYAAEDAAALNEWQQERIRHRLALLHKQRPPVFAAPGELHPDIAAWCDRFAAGKRGSLVLVGPVGTGKTWSIWRAVEYLITAHQWRGRFEMCTAYQFRRTIAPPLDESQLDVWARADLLALDDLGSQRISEWDSGFLSGLIDERWSQGRPFIVTSNDGQLAPLLGERAASRTRDLVTIVHLTGADRRIPR